MLSGRIQGMNAKGNVIRYIAQPLLPEAAEGTSPRGAGIPYTGFMHLCLPPAQLLPHFLEMEKGSEPEAA